MSDSRGGGRSRLNPVWQLWPVRSAFHPTSFVGFLSVSNSALCRLSPVTCRCLSYYRHARWLALPLSRTAPITCRVCPSSPQRRAHREQGQQGQAGHSAPPVLTHPAQGHPIVDLPDPLPKTSDPTQLLARNTQLRDPPVEAPVLPSSHTGGLPSIEACLHLPAQKARGEQLPLCEQQL